VLPEYASCEGCGEIHRAALRRTAAGILCANCADTRHRRARCVVCEQEGPVERHHIAGRRQSAETAPVCLTCHAILSRWQYGWHPSWRSAPRPFLFTMQGLLDMMILHTERSRQPVRSHSWAVAVLLLCAAFLLLQSLRPDALAELSDLTLKEARP